MKKPKEDVYKKWMSQYRGVYIEEPSKLPSSRNSSVPWKPSGSKFNIAVIAAAIS